MWQLFYDRLQRLCTYTRKLATEKYHGHGEDITDETATSTSTFFVLFHGLQTASLGQKNKCEDRSSSSQSIPPNLPYLLSLFLSPSLSSLPHSRPTGSKRAHALSLSTTRQRGEEERWIPASRSSRCRGRSANNTLQLVNKRAVRALATAGTAFSSRICGR